MKNLKKLLAVIITLAIMATMMVPAFAAEEISEDAQIVSELELLVGDGEEGVTSEYLAKNTVRIQAAIVFLKLVGKLDEATAFDGEETFEDADQVKWAEGKNILAYLKANPDLGWVGDAGNFKPQDPATAQEIYKVLLEVLGFKAKVADSEDFDFEWKDVFAFAADNGLEKIADVEELTNDDLATAIVEGLLATTKDGVTLVEKLVELEVIDEDLAIELGLISGELAIESAAAIGVDEIKVVFSTAAEADTKVELLRGLVPYTTTNTWSEDGKSVVLKSSFALPAGDYTVKVGELTAAVKVEAEKAVSMEIKSVGLQNIADAEVNVVLLNQYGKEMAVSGVTITAFNLTRGKSVVVNGLKLKLDDAAFAVNDVIVVSAVHTSGLTATKNVNIIAKNAADSFKFESIVLPADQTRVLPSETLYEVKYTLLNQYGEAIKLTSLDSTVGGVMFASTDNTVVNPADMTITDGVLKIKALKEGTATLTALVVATGKVDTLLVTVEGPAAIKSITVAAPASLIVAEEAVELPFVAVDQYGAQVAPKDISDALITGDSTGMSFGTSNSTVIAINDFAFSKGKLTLTPSSHGTATIYVYYKGVLQNSVTFTVEKKAEAVRISGIKDLPTMYEIGSQSSAFTNANVVVIDQYNREIKDYAGTIIIAAKDGTADKVLYDAGTKVFSAAAAAAGSEVFTFSIDGVAGSAFDVTMGTIETKDIATYELSEAGTIYVGRDKTLTLTGKTADGKVVQLKTGKVTLTTSSDAAIATIDTDLKVTAVAKGEAMVAVWGGAAKLAEVKVTVSDAVPVITSIEFTAATIAANGDIKSIISVKDQYGVDITSGLNVNTDIFVVGDISAAAEAVEVTVIAKNGVKGTATIAVTAGV